MKKYLSFLVIGLFFSSGLVFAEENIVPPTPTQTKESVRVPENNPLDVTNIKTQQKEVRKDIEKTKEEIKNTREEVKKKLDTEREAFKTDMDGIRTEAKKVRDEKMTELKTKLGKIKDEKKKAIVEGLYTQFNDINIKTTDSYDEKVSQMEKVLTNIESRVTKAQAKGLDMTVAQVKITDVKTLIASTKADIANQAVKNYTVNVTTESTLKTATKATRDLLKIDLDKLKAQLKIIHDKLRDTNTTLAGIHGIDDEVKVKTTN